MLTRQFGGLPGLGGRACHTCQHSLTLPVEIRHMDIIGLSNALSQFETLLERVVTQHRPVIVARDNAEPVVLVSLSDWHAMEETTHLLSTDANADRLRSAIGQLDNR
jgi:antitoxin YefM